MESHIIFEKLRPYQQEAVIFMRKNPRTLMFDDMGLGKTITTLTSIYKAIEEEGINNVIIFCPKFALYVWQLEIRKWFDADSIVYTGTPKKRKDQWNHFLASHQVCFLITTYAMMDEIIAKSEESKDAGRFAVHSVLKLPLWDGIIADEIHTSGLLNQKTKTWKSFDKFARNIKYVYQLTGTPIRQGVVDLYAPLHVVDPVKFKSYWTFVNDYCIKLQGRFGMEIERRPKNPDQFREMLKSYMIRRVKADVLHDLPGKQRQPFYIAMSDAQAKFVADLVETNIAEVEDDVVLAANTMVVMLKVRQVLVCPKLVGINESGAALDTIIEMGSDLLDNQKPFVIFTPFRAAIPYIEEAISNSIKNVHVYSVTGGLTAEEFSNQWQGFQNDTHKRKILLCVIKSGASFHATCASTAFFLGYEWDFNQNTQSEDRLCRFGQKDFVNLYYMMHKDTIDEDVAQRLNAKQEANDWVIGNEEQYAMLRRRYKMSTNL